MAHFAETQSHSPCRSSAQQSWSETPMQVSWRRTCRCMIRRSTWREVTQGYHCVFVMSRTTQCWPVAQLRASRECDKPSPQRSGSWAWYSKIVVQIVSWHAHNSHSQRGVRCIGATGMCSFEPNKLHARRAERMALSGAPCDCQDGLHACIMHTFCHFVCTKIKMDLQFVCKQVEMGRERSSP
jgi:hypothetical protein